MVKKFANDNMHDAKQKLQVIVNQKLVGFNQNLDDNHGYIFIINSDRKLYEYLSWLYRIPLYYTTKKNNYLFLNI